MNFDLSLNSYVFARLRSPTVYLQRALAGYLLRVQLEIQVEPKRTEAPHVLVDHRLTLQIDSGGQRLLIGHAEADSRMWMTPYEHSYPYSIGYSLQISHEQLLGIELARSSRPGPVEFAFRLDGIGLIIGTNETVRAQGSDGIFTVPTEHWISQLLNCGFANKTLFEIDLPIGPNQVVNASPGGHLKLAHTAFQTGQYSLCAIECRRALEALTKELGDAGELSTLGEKKADRELLNARDRIRVLRRELFKIASVGGHTPPSGDISDFALTRPEATLILASTAGIVAASADPRT